MQDACKIYLASILQCTSAHRAGSRPAGAPRGGGKLGWLAATRVSHRPAARRRALNPPCARHGAAKIRSRDRRLARASASAARARASGGGNMGFNSTVSPFQFHCFPISIEFGSNTHPVYLFRCQGLSQDPATVKTAAKTSGEKSPDQHFEGRGEGAVTAIP